MGLIVSVYRDADGYDCTNGGLSSKVQQLCIVNVDGPDEPSDDAPAARLVNGPSLSGREPNPIVQPDDDEAKRRHSMFGGNFAACSDSRWTAAIRRVSGMPVVGSTAVAIHDRYE